MRSVSTELPRRLPRSEEEAEQRGEEQEDDSAHEHTWCSLTSTLSRAGNCISDAVRYIYASSKCVEKDTSARKDVYTDSNPLKDKLVAERPYAYRINSLIVGNSGTGKSSLVQRFVDKTFYDTYASTIGVEFASKIMEVNGGCKIKQHLWDTSGHASFASLTKSYYFTAVVVFVVYSVTDRRSFQQLTNWMVRTRSMAPSESILIIVGNKIEDAERRVVSSKEGRVFAEKYGALYIEASAKSGVGVKEVFQLGAASVWRAIHDHKTIDPILSKGVKALR